jgi:lysophospholipase L1-like esterase
VVAFDNRIPGWAAGLTTAQSPIVVVDQWTGFDAVADTGDGVHPNDAGFRKMADRWYPAARANARRHRPAAAVDEPVALG